MAVDRKHKLYAAREAQWAKIADAVEGEDSLKAHDSGEKSNRERYIPVLPGHDRAAKTKDGKTVDEYLDIYLRYAVFYGQPSIVLDGMLGLCFKRPPAWEGLDSIDRDLSNITLDGKDRDTYAADVLEEVIRTQWGGVLVDWSGSENRAYQRLYEAADVGNWKWLIFDGVPVLSQVVLRERVEEDAPDGFGTVEVEQYRVLELVPIASVAGVPNGDGVKLIDRLDPAGNYDVGVYVQQLWRRGRDEGGDESWVRVGPPIIPERNGSPLWFLPFELLDNKPGTPPMLGIVNMALAHYRNSADRENALHKAGVPTLGLFGFQTNTDDIRPGSLIRSTSSDAHADYIQTGGSGCAELEKGMEGKQKAIAMMASRMLTDDQPKGAETPEAHELRMVGSDARLSRLAKRASDVLSRSCAYQLWWHTGRELQDCIDSVTVSLNRHFFERRMSAGDLQTLWMIHLDGGISRELYEETKHRGGFARDGYSPDEERQLADLEEQNRRRNQPSQFLDGQDAALSA